MMEAIKGGMNSRCATGLKNKLDLIEGKNDEKKARRVMREDLMRGRSSGESFEATRGEKRRQGGFLQDAA